MLFYKYPFFISFVMIDAVKDYLAPKSFGIVAYICVIVHFLCGLTLITIATQLRASENEKFYCSAVAESTIAYKTQVDKACFSRYDQVYNSPVPLYGFVLLSIGSTLLVSVIYSLFVWTRVDEIVSSHKRKANGETENHGQNKRTVYVFNSYFIHLVVRSLLGIIFTVLQHLYFYPNGFDWKFSCSLPPSEETFNTNARKNASGILKSTIVTCENSSASEKLVLGIFVSGINSIIALVVLVEVIYLCRRLPIFNGHSGAAWSCDNEFVITHFLREQYVPQLTYIECIEIYKQEVLNRPPAPDINNGQKIGLDDMYIDVLIHSGRAQHDFSKDMERHEIYDVYTQVPSTSIRLEKIKDIFYANEDTKGILPRTILVIGRPGMGKTVLTEKILRDWAKEIDEYYCDKMVFLFSLRWFGVDKSANMSLKEFLEFGTSLKKEMFESIYDKIAKEPQKAILIFDGLDEFDSIVSLRQSRTFPNDPNACMPAINLFTKLVWGDLLKGATVIVTSRPTADDFYSKLHCDRNVEIIGFTRDKIEKYVIRFCANNEKSDPKSKIWNHIKSSSELLNLCYIPSSCFIVCVTLSEYLSDENDTSALPATLTELYEEALHYLEKNHHRHADEISTGQEALKKLQKLAFQGLENGKLLFDHKLFDGQMKTSGLLNSLSNPIFPSQPQFCFVHLTIQEFLAARHLTETSDPAEIKKFISDHVGSEKWRLVLQFIAGLLGMFNEKYKHSVLAFAESFNVICGQITLDYNQFFIMKCLREMDHEKVAKEICETTAMNNIEKIHCDLYYASPSEWTALTFVCKHMKKLTVLDLAINEAACLAEILELLRKRCINKILFVCHGEGWNNAMEQVFGALMKLRCGLNHQHTKLTSLRLTHATTTNARLPSTCTFFKEGHARHLEMLDLTYNGITSLGISKLCEILNNNHCTELTCLYLSGNPIGDEGASALCDTLNNGLCTLNMLDVSDCSLTDQFIPDLCNALEDKRCKLDVLSLGGNNIGDKSVDILVEKALTKKHCKLTELDLERCPLTDECKLKLRKALQDKRCKGKPCKLI